MSRRSKSPQLPEQSLLPPSKALAGATQAFHTTSVSTPSAQAENSRLDLAVASTEPAVNLRSPTAKVSSPAVTKASTLSPDSVVLSKVLRQGPPSPVLASTHNGTVPNTPPAANGTPSAILQHSKRSKIATDPQRQASSKGPSKWTAMPLTSASISALLLLTLGMTGAIASLTVVSHTRSGILEVDDLVKTIATYQIRKALLWTTVPVFLFSVYAMIFGSVVSALSDRQPYVELLRRRREGVPADTSILLDYRVYWSLIKPLVAARRRHVLLSISFFWNLILSVVLNSLTAHLLYPAAVTQDASTMVVQNMIFNESEFTFEADLLPTFDIVASTQIYGGSLPAWTTSNTSFVSFSAPTMPRSARGLANFSIITQAYSAELDCIALDPSIYSVRLDDQEWRFNGNDRGCSLSWPVTVSSDFEYYMQTYANVSCDASSGVSRLVVIAASVSDGNVISPTTFTVVSCKTAYYSSTGLLSVSYNPGISLSPTILSYNIHNSTLIEDPRPLFWSVFEVLLHEASIIDDTAKTSATDFGRIVLDHARHIAPQTFLDPKVLLNSTERIFSAVYAVMATSLLFSPTDSNGALGTLSTLVTRLLIVDQIAYAIMVLLFLVALTLVWILLDVRNHESILFEQPIGLLGAALLLRDSDVMTVADVLRGDSNVQDGKYLESFEKLGVPRRSRWRRYLEIYKTQDTTAKGHWTVENPESPQDLRIRRV